VIVRRGEPEGPEDMTVTTPGEGVGRPGGPTVTVPGGGTGASGGLSVIVTGGDGGKVEDVSLPNGAFEEARLDSPVPKTLVG